MRDPFGDPFAPTFPDILSYESGADARASYESRQIAVIGSPRAPNGVQGVAGSNPAIPTHGSAPNARKFERRALIRVYESCENRHAALPSARRRERMWVEQYPTIQ